MPLDVRLRSSCGIPSHTPTLKVGFAATGIGVHLLVDRDANAVVVHSRPVQGQYLDRSAHPYGEAVPVPGTGVVLDTGPLERFAR